MKVSQAATISQSKVVDYTAQKKEIPILSS